MYYVKCVVIGYRVNTLNHSLRLIEGLIINTITIVLLYFSLSQMENNTKDKKQEKQN